VKPRITPLGVATLCALWLLCLSPPASGGAARSAATKSCTPGLLAAGVNVIAGSAGAGGISYSLVIHNRSAHACALGSHPRLTLLDGAGRPLPTHLRRTGTQATRRIASGSSVRARLRFSADIPGRGEPQRGSCEPLARSARVTLTDPSHGTLLARIRPPTSVCEHGAISEGPLDPVKAFVR
jgi:hypothetical protein